MRTMSYRSLAVLVLVAAAGTAAAQIPPSSRPPAPAERAEYIRSHYTKFEYRIPVRDGVRLFTSIYPGLFTSAGVKKGGCGRNPLI